MDQSDRLQTIFAAMQHHLPVVTALAGTIPAQIHVDDPADPQAAIIQYKHRVYLAGAADGAFLGRVFAEAILPKAHGEFVCVLYYTPDDWTPVIEETLHGNELYPRQRQYYAFRALRHDWRTLLPEGFRVALVDADLLAQSHLINMDALQEEMCSERLTVEDFLAHSFGTCVIHDDALVAWCLSEYNTGARCEIGIETQEAYQRRGLATAAASALIEHAASQGITEIGWHCYARNEPSAAAALAIGFEHVNDYPSVVVYRESDDA